MNKDKILKIMIISILTIFFVIGIFAIYKFTIINKIFNKMQEYVNKDNYYIKVTDGESIVSEIYYRNGTGKMVMSNGTYTWTDGKVAYLVNEKENTIEELDFTSPLLISNEYVGSLIPGYSKSKFQKFLLAGSLETSIKTKKYKDLKYYVITTEEEYAKTVWINQNTLLPSQISAKIGDVEKTYGYNIAFGTVTYKDIEKPETQENTTITE